VAGRSAGKFGFLGYVTEKGVPATFRGHLAAIKLASIIAGRLELGLFVKEFDAGTWLGNADSFDNNVWLLRTFRVSNEGPLDKYLRFA
jgi:hypothetical protein